MTYNCIIIDDEQPARQLLENYCQKIDSLNVVGSYKSALEALNIIRNEPIDIIFLDIQMPDISGIDFLKTLKMNSAKVILTTAYREYALEGYELDAIDYLLKPIEFHRFLRAIEKVNAVHQKRQDIEVKDIEETLTIRADKKEYRLPLSDILYIKSENEYLKYVTKTHGNLIVYGALKNVAESLKNIPQFFRIHRSYIVNLNYITYVEGSRIRLNGEYFTISETYRVDFFKAWK